MKKGSFFWVGFADLMTSLFFIMLVLASLSFVFFGNERKELTAKIQELNEIKTKLENSKTMLENSKDSLKILAEKAIVIQTVDNLLLPLKQNPALFRYDSIYKRFNLAFEVKFERGRYNFNSNDIDNFNVAKSKIDDMGRELLRIIKQLDQKRISDSAFRNVSYLIVVSGSASKLPGDVTDLNYELSYKRAYNLYKYWRDQSGIDFDDPRYHRFLEFQIAGIGEGGVNRFRRDPGIWISEEKNQRFIINIIPKIGDL